MRKLQSILYATDFRPPRGEAEALAVRFAELFGSHITLLHVMGSSDSSPALVHQYPDAMTSQMRSLAESLAARGVLIDETVVQVGHPADAIVRKAAEIDADLILIAAGRHTREHLSFLGPVASAVTQHASRPVLAIRPGSPRIEFRKILCPVDMSETSARGLANAIQLARTFGGHVIVLTVVPALHWMTTVTQSAGLSEAASLHEQDWRSEFDQFLQMCGLSEVSWEKQVRHGEPHEEIFRCANDHEADLIVMGSTGRTGLARVLLGSVTRRVIQQLPCSLLVVKQQNVLEEVHDDELQTIKVLYAQGRALLEARSQEAALDKFAHVLIRDPFHVGSLLGKAAALEALGRPADAERSRHRAHTIELHELPVHAVGVGD